MRCSFERSSAATSSKAGAGSSKLHAPAMCMCATPSSMWRTSASRALRRSTGTSLSRQLEEHPLHVRHVVAGRGGALRVLEAPREPLRHEQESDLLERLVGRGDLGHELPAVA